MIKQSPKNLDARNRLGLLLMKEERMAEAQKCFQEIIEIDADNVQALAHLEITSQLLNAP